MIEETKEGRNEEGRTEHSVWWREEKEFDFRFPQIVHWKMAIVNPPAEVPPGEKEENQTDKKINKETTDEYPEKEPWIPRIRT